MKVVFFMLSALALGGCMYPGVDKTYPMGESLASLHKQQNAYPDEQYDDAHIVEGLDGNSAKNGYDSLRNSSKVSDSSKVDSSIKIKIGK